MGLRKKINTIEELEALLAKAYWIEKNMEIAIWWKSYVRGSPDRRLIVVKLARESMQHKATLQRLGLRLGNLDLEAMAAGLGRADVDLNGKPDRELMDEIRAHDVLAHGIYKRLLTFVHRDLIKRAWTGDEGPEEFFRVMRELVKAEEGHLKLVTPLALGAE